MKLSRPLAGHIGNRAGIAVASSLGLLLIVPFSHAQTVAAATTESAMSSTAIRPFRIHVPETELVELRRRITANPWPEKETVTDHSQGVPLAKFAISRAIGRPTTTGARSKRG
jgi:hypothetical protein